jgi:Major Facilitator Superfamily
VRSRIVRLRALAKEALADLFDQEAPFGRLALTQVLMLGGDTLVTISLAGSLFFSISPTEAKSKVLLYLLLTIAPFAVVSPLLGPVIDRSRGARRAMVVFSAAGRMAIVPFMARDIHSLWLFPEAFLILVLSKLYLVTRGALITEIAEAEAEHEVAVAQHSVADAYLGDAPTEGGVQHGLAGWNAQLTLLGTLAGFVVSIPGVLLLKTVGAPGVLIFAGIIFLLSAISGIRLKLPKGRRHDHVEQWQQAGASVVDGPPPPEVLLGLTANSLLRGVAGFLVFLLAFGLRRQHAALWWYGLALGGSGIGALLGLSLVPRLRSTMREPQMLLLALFVVGLAASGAAYAGGGLPVEVLLAVVIGVAGAVGQPSFDAMTQRLVPVAAQGRAFARFATRQQLVWVLGALIPVAIALTFEEGDVAIAVIGLGGALFYLVARIVRVVRPRSHQQGRAGRGRSPREATWESDGFPDHDSP